MRVRGPEAGIHVRIPKTATTSIQRALLLAAQRGEISYPLSPGRGNRFQALRGLLTSLTNSLRRQSPSESGALTGRLGEFTLLVVSIVGLDQRWFLRNR